MKRVNGSQVTSAASSVSGVLAILLSKLLISAVSEKTNTLHITVFISKNLDRQQHFNLLLPSTLILFTHH